MKKCYINEVRHDLNPLPIYCRLRDVGINMGISMELATLYERYIYKPINTLISEEYCKKRCTSESCLLE